MRLSSELDIEGWGLPEYVSLMCECSRMQHRRGTWGAVVEIGTYMGSTFLPLVNCKQAEERALAIDPFDDASPEGISYAKGGRSVLEMHLCTRASGQSHIDIWEISSDRVSVHELSARLEGQPARLFHVDGSRSARSAEWGLHLAEAVLAPDGCIFLDDFLNEGWPSVTEGAFAHFAAGSKLVPFALVKCKLGLCFSSFRDAFCETAQEAINSMELVQAKSVTMFNYRLPMGR